jgi:hypothetical protein
VARFRATHARCHAPPCWQELDEDANILATRFCKSIIRSRASLTYDAAQQRIDDVCVPLGADGCEGWAAAHVSGEGAAQGAD